MRIPLSLLAIALFTASLPAADEAPTDSLEGIVIGRDWPNWRGPTCSGAAGDSGAELVTDPAEAKLAWTSELEFRPAWGGPEAKGYPCWGYSDFAIVDGRLYYFYTEASGPVSPRDKELALAELERVPKLKRVISDPAERERLAAIMGQVRSDDVIVCIDANTGRTLWTTNFREQGLSPVHMRRANYSFQGTPAVAYGKVYAIGNGLTMYAVDQISGEPIWRGDGGEYAMQLWTHYQDVCMRGRVRSKRARNFCDGATSGADGCPMPAGGVVAMGTFDGSNHQSAGMVGIDAATGRRLWRVPRCTGQMNATPLRWRHEGKEYFVSAYTDRAVCVEPRSGRELWSIDGRFNSKAMGVIAGDLLINPGMAWSKKGGKRGPNCLRMTPEGAEILWEHDTGDLDALRFISPCVYKDIAYITIAKGKSRHKGGVCFDPVTGKVLGTNAAAKGYNVLAADDRIWGDKSGALAVAGIGVEEAHRLPREFPGPQSETTQVLVGGRLYVRSYRRAACIDLRRGAQPPAAEEDPPVAADIPGLVAQLGHRHQAVRERAAEALAAKGAAAAGPLAKALGDDDWLVRQAAARALEAMGSAGAAAAKALAGRLPAAVDRASWGQVMLLLRAIEATDPAAFAGCVDALAKRLVSEDDGVVFRACWALLTIGPAAAPAAEALAAVVARDDAHQSRWAAQALAEIGPDAAAAVPVLERMLDSEVGDVVAWSLHALRRIGPPASAMPRLIELMVEPRVGDYTGRPAGKFITEFKVPVIAWHAGECLKALGPQVIPAVAAALDRVTFSQGSGAILMPFEVLAHFGEAAKEALPAMRKVADPDHPGVQRNPNYHSLCRVMGRPLPAEGDEGGKGKD